MILIYRNQEYCLSDWKINPNDKSVCYRNIISTDGKNTYRNHFSILNSSSSLYPNHYSFHAGQSLCKDIHQIYVEIYKSNILKSTSLEDAKNEVDKFLLRVNNIKVFI